VIYRTCLERGKQVRITEEDIVWRAECLKEIKDERRQSGHFPHKLIDVPVIGLTTIRAGWDGFNVREDLKKFLELPHGIPQRRLRGYVRG
jgi:hypothetical protein